jgi:hypothetical protein
MKGLDLLKGVRIVEQGTFITGPCTGMMLADLGADVIKLESPDGDPYRAYQGDNYSPHFQAYNRNKRSVVCDLKQSADRELFERLVSEADVYIQNFRPGTPERLGLGPDELRQRRAGTSLGGRYARSFQLSSFDTIRGVPFSSGSLSSTSPSSGRWPRRATPWSFPRTWRTWAGTRTA